jgi:hypothetical protein
MMLKSPQWPLVRFFHRWHNLLTYSQSARNEMIRAKELAMPKGRTGFYLCLVMLLSWLPCCAAAEEKPVQKANDKAAEIKALLKERQETLAKLSEILLAQYREGAIDFRRVAGAQRDALRAAADLEQTQQERLTSLRKVQDLANTVFQIAKDKFKSGSGTESEVLQAKAMLLEAKIEVLREERNAKPDK